MPPRRFSTSEVNERGLRRNVRLIDACFHGEAPSLQQTRARAQVEAHASPDTSCTPRVVMATARLSLRRVQRTMPLPTHSFPAKAEGVA